MPWYHFLYYNSFWLIRYDDAIFGKGILLCADEIGSKYRDYIYIPKQRSMGSIQSVNLLVLEMYHIMFLSPNARYQFSETYFSTSVALSSPVPTDTPEACSAQLSSFSVSLCFRALNLQ